MWLREKTLYNSSPELILKLKVSTTHFQKKFSYHKLLMVNRRVNFLTLFLFFQTISLKGKEKKNEIQEREKSLLFKVWFAHWFRWSTTSANSSYRTRDLKRKDGDSVLCPARGNASEGSGLNEGNRRKWIVLRSIPSGHSSLEKQ